MLPAIQTPQRPEGAAPARSVRGGKPTPKSSMLSSRKAASPLAPSAMLESAIRALVREEALFRSAVEAQCSSEQNDIALMLGDIRDGDDRIFRETAARQLSAIAAFSASAQPQVEATHAIVGELLSLTESIAKSLKTQVDMQNSEERKQLTHLQVENLILRRDLAEAKEEVDRRVAECLALRDTLSRRLIRTSAENEIIRQSVRAEVQKCAVDYDEMRRQLQERVDLAILNFDKSTYEGSLRSLQELALQSRDRFRQQAATLNNIIGAIGAQDSIDEAKTIHSNLPALYRKQLRLQSKEQLLNLIDVLSFEDGIVECVGRALYAVDPNKTQNVFN